MDDLAKSWDDRVSRRAAAMSPAWQARIAWMRAPSRRWLRLAAGVLFILGGLLSILPILGLWMLPVGLALLAEDVPPLKAALERAARWLEARFARWRR